MPTGILSFYCDRLCRHLRASKKNTDWLWCVREAELLEQVAERLLDTARALRARAQSRVQSNIHFDGGSQ